MSVIEFKKKEEKEPEEVTITGKARCILCKYEWVAVAPAGTVWLDCPECHSMKGIHIFSCVRKEEHWTCNCGNDLFHITKEGTYCPNCGTWQYPD